MAPNRQTQHDPNLREPQHDQLNGFDPIAVFGFSIDTPYPDEATIRARYHKLVRLIGVIYRDDNRLPYTLADVNRARENLLFSYRRTVEVTQDYHKPKWNPTADERDLTALLTPMAAGAQAGIPSSSIHPAPNTPFHGTRGDSIAQTQAQRPSAFFMGSPSGRPETPTNNPYRRRRASGNDSSSDDICIVSSRSSVSSRKDPVSEVTKQEMRQLVKEEDEARLRAKGEANRNKDKNKSKGQSQAQYGTGGIDDEEVVYLGTGNEIPGYIHVGHDRRPGGGGRLMVMCVDCRNHANFYALQPTGRRIGGFRLDRASYDDVDQSPAMLTVLRNIGEIAPAHMRASRQEMKAYYEVMIAQREADAQKP